MATSRRISYCQAILNEGTQSETPSRPEYDDGSEALADLQRIADRLSTVGRLINSEADKLERAFRDYQITKQRTDTNLRECNVLLTRLLREQEDKTREIKKLNLIIFETVETEGLRRTDEYSKKRVENLCRLATDMPITVQWATQLEKSLPGMCITRVRFFTEEDKMMLMANEENLLTMGIYMDHDLTESEVKKQMQLDEMVEEGRSQGKVTFADNDTVCIDGVLHTLV